MFITLAYRFLLGILFPAVAVATAAAALRGGSLRYLQQRLGNFDPGQTTPHPLWIHCASVGETNAALAFARTWLKKHPNERFVFTSNTLTAAELLSGRSMVKEIRHCYLPLDYPLFCRRFLDAVRPRCALIMETEIWMNLFGECRKRELPLFIINARLSQRSLNGARYFRAYYRHSLAAVNKILARSRKDAAAFAALGVAADKIETPGNLKQAVRITDDAIGAPLQFTDRSYILAASTHADEEIQVSRAWRSALEAQRPATAPLLVIAPRHPRRGRAIARQLQKQGFCVQLRSQTETVHPDTAIYIADTVGELPALIRHAQLVFMGGSLVPVGGHNVLEAAQLGIPQVTGRYTQNFDEEVATLTTAGGLLKANDEKTLAEAFQMALQHAPEHTAMAQKALSVMRQQQDVAAAYVTRLEAAGIAAPDTPQSR